MPLYIKEFSILKKASLDMMEHLLHCDELNYYLFL